CLCHCDAETDTTLRAELEIRRMRREVVALRKRFAETQAIDQAKAALLEYLATQKVALDEDELMRGVKVRRNIFLRALRQLIANGRVQRTGNGQKGNRYKYAIPGPRNGAEQHDPAGTDPEDHDDGETPEPQFRWKA